MNLLGQLNKGYYKSHPNSKYFVLDNTVVDFPTTSNRSDSLTGDTLQYYIEDDDGDLILQDLNLQ